MTTEAMFKVDIEGARPNWIGSMSGRLHSRLPFPDAFDGGFDSYYSRRGQTVSGGYPRSTERRHFLNSFNPSSAQREPALHWDNINTPGIASYFNREGPRQGGQPAQTFRRHVKVVEPPTQVQKAEGRRFLEQPVPSVSRPSRRREMPEPSYSSRADRPSGRRCFDRRGSSAPLTSMAPATASAFGNADRGAGGAQCSARTQKKRAEVLRPGVHAGRSSKSELIRVEDTDRYFLQFHDNPNFRRFLRTLKPIKRNPVERRRELRMLKSLSERQREVDLVRMLDEVAIGAAAPGGAGEQQAAEETS